MNRSLTLAVVCVVSFVVRPSGAGGQDWDPNKVYNADVGGYPSNVRYIDVNGGFPGWNTDDTAGSIINLAPTASPAIEGLYGNFFQVFNGKQKHRTSNWGALDGAASTRTALFWRLYIPSSPTVTKFPSIQVRTRSSAPSGLRSQRRGRRRLHRFPRRLDWRGRFDHQQRRPTR